MATKRSLVRSNQTLQGRVTRLSDEKSSLQRRLSNVLAMVLNGPDNLAQVFGKLVVLPVDEAHKADKVQRYLAESNFAQVELNPATGEIVVTDPHGVVNSIKVDFDEDCELDTSEQVSIRRFLADVAYSRQVSNVPIIGPMSLAARSSQRDDVNVVNAAV